jgi:uncharacterized membrane protein YjgN (DUF898 family)
LAAHTYVDDKPMAYNPVFTDWLVHILVTTFLTVITLGLYLPWRMVKMESYYWSHVTVEDGRTCSYDGTAGGLFGTALTALFLTVFTCGFGSPWAICLVNKYHREHTLIGGECLSFSGGGAELLVMALIGQILIVVTLGIFSPFHVVNLQKWLWRNTQIQTA